MMFENLIFASPWVLLTALFIPVLWWVLRFMPPKPRVTEFPSLFMLKGIERKSNTPARTSWVMLLLRALLFIFFIIAFAEPVYNPSNEIAMPSSGTLLIAVDNGWQSAAHWQKRMRKLGDYISQARRADVNVVIVETAKRHDNHLVSHGPMPAEAAQKTLTQLNPQPWAADYKEASSEIDKIKRSVEVGTALFLSSGTETESDFINRFDIVIDDSDVNTPYTLHLLKQSDRHLEFSLSSLSVEEFITPLVLEAYDASGNALDVLKIQFPGGVSNYEFKWDILPEFAAKLASVKLQSVPMASATVLFDSSRYNHKAGIIANHKTEEGSRELLSGAYYIAKALEHKTEVTVDRLDVLLAGDFSALLLPDDSALTADEKKKLLAWVENGGLLVRFAGPKLAAEIKDDLLPVALRYGERSTSGSMTWEKPLKLAPIAQSSPFWGLTVQDDIVVKSQILAEPSSDTFDKTWLQLEDGTPLITGGQKGKGNVVLVHSSADPQWSNFCYSGLFVEVLERLVMMGGGVNIYHASAMVKPSVILDAFGASKPAGDAGLYRALNAGDEFVPSPLTPPGIYGENFNFRIFNLGDHIDEMQKLEDLPSKIKVLSYSAAGELHLKATFIKAGLVILLLELFATLWYRGALLALTIMLCAMHPALAEETKFNPIDKLYLAYAETGNAAVDKLSYDGLKGLADVVNSRTAITIEGVVAADLEKSDLSYYPFIYWPMSASQAFLSSKAAENLQNYIMNGGLVLFDTCDQQLKNKGISETIGAERLREVTASISIPELIKIPQGHILRQSFYLLDSFPGLYEGGEVWVEKEPNPASDSVPSIVIGSANWAAAWSQDATDNARYIVQPGGEIQREKAYKFGINLLMVGLTGNYKSDQIHVKGILERIGK